MQPNEHERVARYLDGEKLVLTPQERLLALSLDIDQRVLAGALDQDDVPPEALHRVRAKMLAQLSAGRHGTYRGLALTAAAAVVATAIVLWAVLSGGHVTGHNQQLAGHPSRATAENSLAAMANELDPSDSGKIELISVMAMDTEELDQAITLNNPETAVFAGN